MVLNLLSSPAVTLTFALAQQQTLLDQWRERSGATTLNLGHEKTGPWRPVGVRGVWGKCGWVRGEWGEWRLVGSVDGG